MMNFKDFDLEFGPNMNIDFGLEPNDEFVSNENNSKPTCEFGMDDDQPTAMDAFGMAPNSPTLFDIFGESEEDFYGFNFVHSDMAISIGLSNSNTLSNGVDATTQSTNENSEEDELVDEEPNRDLLDAPNIDGEQEYLEDSDKSLNETPPSVSDNHATVKPRILFNSFYLQTKRNNVDVAISVFHQHATKGRVQLFTANATLPCKGSYNMSNQFTRKELTKLIRQQHPEYEIRQKDKLYLEIGGLLYVLVSRQPVKTKFHNLIVYSKGTSKSKFSSENYTNKALVQEFNFAKLNL